MYIYTHIHTLRVDAITVAWAQTHSGSFCIFQICLYFPDFPTKCNNTLCCAT